jgi:hypothetical protein
MNFFTIGCTCRFYVLILLFNGILLAKVNELYSKLSNYDDKKFDALRFDQMTPL